MLVLSIGLVLTAFAALALLAVRAMKGHHAVLALGVSPRVSWPKSRPRSAAATPRPTTSILRRFVHCMDGEIVAWLEQRERRRKEKQERRCRSLTDAQKTDLTTHRYSRAVISRVGMPSSSTYQSPMIILIAGDIS